jgi:hypothetical protein
VLHFNFVSVKRPAWLIHGGGVVEMLAARRLRYLAAWSFQRGRAAGGSVLSRQPAKDILAAKIIGAPIAPS